MILYSRSQNAYCVSGLQQFLNKLLQLCVKCVDGMCVHTFVCMLVCVHQNVTIFIDKDGVVGYFIPLICYYVQILCTHRLGESEIIQ